MNSQMAIKINTKLEGHESFAVEVKSPNRVKDVIEALKFEGDGNCNENIPRELNKYLKTNGVVWIYFFGSGYYKIRNCEKDIHESIEIIRDRNNMKAKGV